MRNLIIKTKLKKNWAYESTRDYDIGFNGKYQFFVPTYSEFIDDANIACYIDANMNNVYNYSSTMMYNNMKFHIKIHSNMMIFDKEKRRKIKEEIKKSLIEFLDLLCET